MSKVTKDFEFTSHFNLAGKSTVELLITGKYYPTQCDRDGLSYDIEAIYDGYRDMDMSFTKSNNLMTAFNICERVEGEFSTKVKDVTESHIEYLTGYKSNSMVLDEDYPNRDTYPVINNGHTQFIVPVS